MRDTMGSYFRSFRLSSYKQETSHKELMNGNFATIKNPFGISVFGSALLRVAPDFVTIRAAITRLEQKPAEAFQNAREAERAVTAFLRKNPVKESGVSRISLAQEYRFVNSERRPIGYVARIGLTLVLSELDRIETVLSGLVEAGANEITSTEFHTVKLKDLRARARELAVNAARQKAEVYATAAKVSLGDVLHIEDVNPNVLRQEFHVAGARRSVQQDIIDSEPEQDTLDPSAIQVGAAVMVAYQIAESGRPSSLSSIGGSMPHLKNIPRRRSRRS